MAVNLSLLAGAGAQFFTNSGVPLAGGLLYTYNAGTTTPAATYTSNTGVTPNSNPIVLDSAGRVIEEIWLTTGSTYKFILKDSTFVQIWSKDNIPGANDPTALNDFKAELANTANSALGDALVGFRQSDSSGNLPGSVGRTVHQKLQETVSVQDFGAVGDGITDDTVAIQAAVTYCGISNKALYAPGGQYLCTNNIEYGEGFELFGDGPNNTVFIKNFITGSAKGLFWCDSGSAVVQLDGVNFSDFTIDGKVETFGFAEQFHLLSMSGVKNARLYNVHLVGNTGDGLYIGSGVVGGVERHNSNIVIDACVFNGRVNNGRNGISVIDCDGILITGCYFTKTSKASMPGAVDFERNSTFSIHRNAKIIGCKFEDIFQTNTCGVIFSIDQTVTPPAYVVDLVVSNCTFDTVSQGVVTAGNTSTRSQSAYPDSVVVRDSYFTDCLNNISTDATGVVISGNTFMARTPSVTKRNRLLIGTTYLAKSVQITNNYFKYSNSTGAIEVRKVQGLTITDNSFSDCQTACVYFYNVADGLLDNVNIANNGVYNVEKQLGGVSTSYLMNAAAGINATNNNIFINANSNLQNNALENNVPLIPGGWTLIFRNSNMVAAAPTSGSWNAGDIAYKSSSITAGAFCFVCSVGGSFGTLSATTADATNASSTLLNVSSVSEIRPNQWILVSGDATPKRITAISGTTVYMSGTYGGVTGTGLSLSWSAPTFVAC